MDPTPIVDAVVSVVSENPKGAAALALVPIVQVGAALLARAVYRGHRTWLHSALSWFAAFPVRPPLPPAKP